MSQYKEDFPIETNLRIVERQALERFMSSWHHQHPLRPEQLGYLGKEPTVKSVGFYHVGDVLYELSEAPEIWHEVCPSAR